MTSQRRARQGRATPNGRPSPGPRGGGATTAAAVAAAAGRHRLVGLAVAAPLLVVLAAVWAYSNSLGGVLVLDDVRAIELNRSIRSLWPLSGPLSPPPAATVSGRPVANLSLAINYALAPDDAREVFEAAREGQPPEVTEKFRRNVIGYHLFNVLVHVLAALALMGVVRRTLALLATPALPNVRLKPDATSRVPASADETWRPALAGRAGVLATVVALIWVTHPLTTSAVTYVVQRVESLASLFYLLTLYGAIRAWTTVGRARARWTAAAIGSCALGMGTKEELMVTAPILAAIWGWLFAPPAEPGRQVRRWPLLVGLASTWIIVLVLVSGERRAPSLELGWGSSWRYLLTQAEVIVHYVRLAIVPTPLVFLYTWPLQSSLVAVWWQAALLVALVGLTAAGLARRHALAFAGAWFFLILAPSSSVLPVVTEVAAEHRMYLPLAAIVACVVIGVYLGARRAAAWPAAAAAPAVLAVVIGLGLTTRARNEDYASSVRLWADTVAKDPVNERARVLYGTALAAAGQLPAAETEFRQAVALDANDPIARVRLGSILLMNGSVNEAVDNLERAATVRPDDPDLNRWLGQAYAARHDERRAVLHLDRALQSMGGSPELLGRLAALLADPDDPTVKDPPRAIELAERAVAATGRREPMLLNVLSVALASAGRFQEASATAAEGVPLARAQGNAGLAAELEQRVAAYRSRAEH